MIVWLAANWLSLVVGLVILALVALCLRNLFPGKGKTGCTGCGCAGCSGCASGGCTGCK